MFEYATAVVNFVLRQRTRVHLHRYLATKTD